MSRLARALDSRPGGRAGALHLFVLSILLGWLLPRFLFRRIFFFCHGTHKHLFASVSLAPPSDIHVSTKGQDARARCCLRECVCVRAKKTRAERKIAGAPRHGSKFKCTRVLPRLHTAERAPRPCPYVKGRERERASASVGEYLDYYRRGGDDQKIR